MPYKEPNKFGGLINKVRKARHKLKYQRTKLDTIIPVDSETDMRVSCDAYSDLQKRLTDVDNCKIEFLKKRTSSGVMRSHTLVNSPNNPRQQSEESEKSE